MSLIVRNWVVLILFAVVGLGTSTTKAVDLPNMPPELRSPAWWYGLNWARLQRLVIHLNPADQTPGDKIDRPGDIYFALGMNEKTDSAKAQGLLEFIAETILSDVRDGSSMKNLESQLPEESRALVPESPLFQSADRPPSKWEILQRFVRHEVLLLGTPSVGSSFILARPQVSLRLEPGILNDRVHLPPAPHPLQWLNPHPRAIATSLSRMRLKFMLNLERLGKDGAVPALHLPILQRYILSSDQYRNSSVNPQKESYSGLPPAYQTIAVEAMNVEDLRLREVEASHEARDSRATPSWTGTRALKHEAELAAASASAQKLSDRERKIFEVGLEVARKRWIADLDFERSTQAKVSYQDLEVSYAKLREIQEKLKRVEADIKGAADRETKSSLRGVRVDLRVQEADAIANFSKAYQTADFFGDLGGFGVDPKIIHFAKNDPRVREAAERSMVIAERELNEMSLELRRARDLAFRQALLPSVAAKMGNIPGSFALCDRVLETLGRRTLIQRSGENMKRITAWGTGITGLIGVSAIALKYAPDRLPPPVDQTRSHRLVNDDLDPNEAFSKAYLAKHGEFVRVALASGMSEQDQTYLANALEDTEVASVPERFRADFAELKRISPNGDVFLNWRAKREKRLGLLTDKLEKEQRVFQAKALDVLLMVLREKSTAILKARMEEVVAHKEANDASMASDVNRLRTNFLSKPLVAPVLKKK